MDQILKLPTIRKLEIYRANDVDSTGGDYETMQTILEGLQKRKEKNHHPISLKILDPVGYHSLSVLQETTFEQRIKLCCVENLEVKKKFKTTQTKIL